MSVAFIVSLAQQFFQTRIGLVVIEIAGEVEQPFRQPAPHFSVHTVNSKLAHLTAKPVAKFFVIQFGASNANYGKVVGQEFALLEVVKSGNQLPFGEVSGRAKD